MRPRLAVSRLGTGLGLGLGLRFAVYVETSGRTWTHRFMDTAGRARSGTLPSLPKDLELSGVFRTCLNGSCNHNTALPRLPSTRLAFTTEV